MERGCFVLILSEVVFSPGLSLFVWLCWKRVKNVPYCAQPVLENIDFFMTIANSSSWKKKSL